MSDPLAALKAATGQTLTETTSDFPNIPSVPLADPAQTNFLASVKSWLEKAAGDGLTSFVSKRYLSSIGVLTQNVDGSFGPRVPPNADIPPAPTNVIANGAMTNILVEWDDPHSAYGNHSHAEVWAAQSDNFSIAAMVGEAPGRMFAHSVGPGSTRYYWIRFVSTSDVAGPFSSVSGIKGETSQDPAWLLDVLMSELTESHLYPGLNERIDLIDIGGPSDLAGGLVAKIRAQAGELNTLGVSADIIGNRLLESALKIQENTDLLYDAGVVVTPGTGEVYIYGVREAENRLDDAEIRLNAAESSISLRATSAYVDEQIALAVLDPSQIADLSGLTARLGAAEVDIDGLAAAVDLKASLITVDSQGARLSTAETEIDALQSEIVSKVENSTFSAAEDRLTTAETRITAYDNAGIINTVSDYRALRSAEEQSAYTALRNLLNGEKARDESVDAVALARTELTANVTEGLEAEAAQRLSLAAAVAETAAQLLQEQTIRATADAAIASSSNTLQARLDTGDFATVKEESSASASRLDGVESKWSVKTQAVSGGKLAVAGMALLAGGEEQSEFMVVANKFTIAPVETDHGADDGSPFFYRTVATVINGVTVPPGAYMKAAYIVDGSIGNAKIANASIDDAKVINLSAAKITFGEMSGDRIEATTLAARLASFTTAYINDAHVNNLSANKINVGEMSADRINAASLYTKLFYAGNAFIGNAAIGSAQIQDLSVGTVKITDGAITSYTSSYHGTLTSGGVVNVGIGHIPTGVPITVVIGGYYGNFNLGGIVDISTTSGGSPGQGNYIGIGNFGYFDGYGPSPLSQGFQTFTVIRQGWGDAYLTLHAPNNCQLNNLTISLIYPKK